LDQKIASLTSEQGWWLDTLHRGVLPYGCNAQGECPAQRLFDRYVDHASKSGVRRRSIETQVGVFLKKAVPKLTRFPGEYREGDYTKTGKIYRFPDLETCRAKFAEMMHQSVPWADIDEEWTFDEGFRDGYSPDDPRM
jgi:hypothetical protein